MATVYLIRASTGCTCCQSENFIQGPYTDKETPENIIAAWRRGEGNPLASQYAKHGVYSLQTHDDAEPISGNRFIIGDQVWGPEIEDKPEN